jgi:predicted amidophosphoribosyltransferase
MQTRQTVDKRARCPQCGARIGFLDASCGRCTADLSLLAAVRGRPYLWYNEAVDLLEAGDPWGAVLKLGAALEMDPKFDEARELGHALSKHLGAEALAERFTGPAATGKE